MTNGEKYKTAKERAEEFRRFCKPNTCRDTKCKIYDRNVTFVDCVCKWLDLEAEEEKPLPCPFCGREINMSMSNCAILCVCGYSSPIDRNLPKVIAAHNRVARKCKDESLRDAERCIEDVANVLSKASPGDSISYAKSAIKIVRRYCKEKKVEVKE